MYKTAVRVFTEVREILLTAQCNKCGRELDIADGRRSSCDEAQEFHDFSVSGGYSTKFPYDMTTVKWVMCADCLKALVESFAVPPETTGYGCPNPSIPAMDTTTGLPVEVHLGVVYPKGEVPEDPDLYPYEVVAEIDTAEWPPLGMYRHYKGGLYTTVGACLRVCTKEPMVLYQELSGESRSWVRPLSEWFETVNGPDDKEKLRFTEIRVTNLS